MAYIGGMILGTLVFIMILWSFAMTKINDRAIKKLQEDVNELKLQQVIDREKEKKV